MSEEQPSVTVSTGPAVHTVGDFIEVVVSPTMSLVRRQSTPDVWFACSSVSSDLIYRREIGTFLRENDGWVYLHRGGGTIGAQLIADLHEAYVRVLNHLS